MTLAYLRNVSNNKNNCDKLLWKDHLLWSNCRIPEHYCNSNLNLLSNETEKKGCYWYSMRCKIPDDFKYLPALILRQRNNKVRCNTKWRWLTSNVLSSRLSARSVISASASSTFVGSNRHSILQPVDKKHLLRQDYNHEWYTGYKCIRVRATQSP